MGSGLRSGARYQPAAPEERDLLDTVIASAWQLRRLERVISTREMENTHILAGKNYTADEVWDATAWSVSKNVSLPSSAASASPCGILPRLQAFSLSVTAR